jgi:hypothetical protein
MEPPESWQLEPERRLAGGHLPVDDDDGVMMMVVPAMMMDNNNLVKGHQRLHEPHHSGSGKKDYNRD